MDNFIMQNTIIAFVKENIGFNIYINFVITLIISILIPSVLNIFNNNGINKVINKITSMFQKYYTVDIEYNMSHTECGWRVGHKSINGDNIILIRALQIYLRDIKSDIKNYKMVLDNIDANKYNEYDDKLEMFYFPLDEIKLNDKFDDIKIITDIENYTINKNNFINLKMRVKSNKNLESVQNFLKYVYDDYIKNQCDKSKNLLIFSHTGTTEDDAVLWNIYPMKSQKTFDNIFFPEKERLKNYLDKFLSGKSSMSKFSLLLYGPPGTGKTSIIKIIANYTERSIKTVKLSNIKSFDNLISIFCGTLLYEKIYDDAAQKHKLKLDKTILVFEDPDADNKIMFKRSDDDKDDDSKQNIVIDDDNKISISDNKKISLSDILQALDGIYDTTGLIIIMTTNFMNKLDPALIRPGRITMKINLKEMTKECAVNMIKYYFSDANPELINITENTITPAELENICQEANDANEVYNLINNLCL
jgi:hypothetical protein